MLEIDYAPRLGVLIPVEKGRVTRLEWQGAPLGSRLVVWAGLHDYYARKSADGAVELAVFVDGKPVSARILRGEDGWKGFEVDTTPQRGGRHSVRFEVESATPEWRNLGLHAEARLGASEELPE